MLQAHTHHTRNVSRSGLIRFVFPVRGAAKVRAVRDAFVMSALLVGFMCSAVRADEMQPALDTLTDTDDADHLVVDVVESLGVDLVRGPSSAVSSGAHALVSTHESPMPMLLWVDSGRSSITLLRAADGHLLSRKVARDTFSDAPYAAAVIATEMVELMRESPLKGGMRGSAEAESLRAHITSHDDVFSVRGSSGDSPRSVGALVAAGPWSSGAAIVTLLSTLPPSVDVRAPDLRVALATGRSCSAAWTS